MEKNININNYNNENLIENFQNEDINNKLFNVIYKFNIF